MREIEPQLRFSGDLLRAGVVCACRACTASSIMGTQVVVGVKRERGPCHCPVAWDTGERCGTEYGHYVGNNTGTSEPRRMSSYRALSKNSSALLVVLER